MRNFITGAEPPPAAEESEANKYFCQYAAAERHSPRYIICLPKKNRLFPNARGGISEGARALRLITHDASAADVALRQTPSTLTLEVEREERESEREGEKTKRALAGASNGFGL